VIGTIFKAKEGSVYLCPESVCTILAAHLRICDQTDKSIVVITGNASCRNLSILPFLACQYSYL